MNVAEKVRVQGHQFVKSQRGNTERQLVNRTEIEIDEGVRYRIEGVGTGRATELASRSPHVRKFLLDLDEAARVTSSTDVAPYTKADQLGAKRSAKRVSLGPVPCVACDGAGWEDCHLCNGSGRVAAKTAKAYRDELH
jgi:hypothetical protein